MKIVRIDNKIIDNIINDKQTFIIVDDNLDNENAVILKSQKQEIQVKITGSNKYNSLEDCLNIIPIDLFGMRKKEAFLKKYQNKKYVNVYRVKYDTDKIEIIGDKKLLEMINSDTLKKNNVGHSSINVYEVFLKSGEEAILKIQKLSSRNDLEEEYKRIKWLQGKCNVPKIYYFKKVRNKKYLLMEKINGLSAHKRENYAYSIGEELKKIHSIDISNCDFKQNEINNLLTNALNNIDTIYPQIKEKYENMTKKDIIQFLNDKKPTDEVLVHGDYSLPNIIINDLGEIYFIDLGDLSISSKYFDLFYLKKSMIRNKQMDNWEELLKGYGIKEIDEDSMKWMEIVDMSLF